MPTKVKEQRIVPVLVFLRRDRTQVHRVYPVAVTDDNGRGRVGLRPELSSEQRTSRRLERQRTLVFLRRLRGRQSDLPAGPGGSPRIQRDTRAGEFVHKAQR